jgi:hypothetical protein
LNNYKLLIVQNGGTYMRVEEFRRRVLSHEDVDLSRRSLNFALGEYLKIQPPEEAGIKWCVEVARIVERHERSLLAVHRDAEMTQALSSPGIALSSKFLLAKINPWVWWVRWQIFRCEGDPPFDRYEAAVEWLVQAGNEQGTAWRRRHTHWPRKSHTVEIGINPKWRKEHGSKVGRLIVRPAPKDPVKTRLEDGSRRLGDLWHVSLTRREIPYKTADEAYIPEFQRDGYEYVRQWFPDLFTKMFPAGREQTWSMPVYPGTQLATLEGVAHEIAELTGFFKVDVVAYILAGVKPVLDPVLIRDVLSAPQTPLDDLEYSRTWAVVEVRDPGSLTQDLWEATYRGLRERLHIKRHNRLTDKDQQLFELVQELGEIPSHGDKGKFWERVRQRWNALAGAEEFKSGRGLALRYKRIIEKLKHP